VAVGKGGESALASENSTPPPAMMTGFFAASDTATAACKFALIRAWAAAGPGAFAEEAFGIVEGLGLGVLAEASVTGPHSAGSVSTAMARFSAGISCSGRMMRSK
jgi:hypothetical protein